MQDGFPVVNDDQDGTQDADLGFQGTAQDVVVCSEHSSSPPPTKFCHLPPMQLRESI